MDIDNRQLYNMLYYFISDITIHDEIKYKEYDLK